MICLYNVTSVDVYKNYRHVDEMIFSIKWYNRSFFSAITEPLVSGFNGEVVKAGLGYPTDFLRTLP